MTSTIYVYSEFNADGMRRVTGQCLSVARQLAAHGAEQVVVLAVGSAGIGARAAAALGEVAFSEPALRCAAIEVPELEAYTHLPHVRAVETAYRRFGPGVVLLGHTAAGRDLAPRLAQRLRLPCISDVTSIETNEPSPVFTRPLYAGKALAKVRPSGPNYVVTIRPGAFPDLPRRTAPVTLEVDNVAVEFDPSDHRVTLVEVRPRTSQTVELSEADYVVSGGMGVGGPAGFDALRPLAETLGAALGASRAACNAGWINHQHQVGQTGKTVSPKLYIACGISGQIQHQAGIRSAKCIVAVNTDANAPIFQIADYGLVADLFAVVPVLNEKLKTVG